MDSLPHPSTGFNRCPAWSREEQGEGGPEPVGSVKSAVFWCRIGRTCWSMELKPSWLCLRGLLKMHLGQTRPAASPTQKLGV